MQYPLLKQKLKQAWQEHEDQYHTGISADHKKSGINGLIKLHHCVMHQMTKKTIIKSFKLTGTFPYDENVIMNECTANITLRTAYQIRKNIDYLKNKLKLQGELFEKDFEDCGIDDNIGKKGKPKDELVVCRRRCLILTNEQFYQREMKKIEDKRIAIEEAAKKKIDNEIRRVTKALEKVAAKELKELEKKRKQEHNAEVKGQRDEAKKLRTLLNEEALDFLIT